MDISHKLFTRKMLILDVSTLVQFGKILFWKRQEIRDVRTVPNLCALCLFCQERFFFIQCYTASFWLTLSVTLCLLSAAMLVIDLCNLWKMHFYFIFPLLVVFKIVFKICNREIFKDNRADHFLRLNLLVRTFTMMVHEGCRRSWEWIQNCLISRIFCHEFYPLFF